MSIIVIAGGSRGIGASTGVDALSPGAIRTELGGGLNAEFESMLASQTALGRVGEPEEVARWVNAQTTEVAGGYTV